MSLLVVRSDPDQATAVALLTVALLLQRTGQLHQILADGIIKISRLAWTTKLLSFKVSNQPRAEPVL